MKKVDAEEIQLELPNITIENYQINPSFVTFDEYLNSKGIKEIEPEKIVNSHSNQT
tara:strand:- start:415 stop:582 length:168 start_codon:yes stop_codon:yes gene_type:complete